jgi:hypothetical protein
MLNCTRWIPFILMMSGCHKHCNPGGAEDTGTETDDTDTSVTGTITTPTVTIDTGTPTDTGTTPAETGDTGLSCVPAPETCDGLDQDCDGVADNGLDVTYYADVDGDGFGDASAATVVACDEVAGPSLVLDNTDCDDADATTHEVTEWFEDVDGDNYTNPDIVIMQCGNQGMAALRDAASAELDCDDTNVNVNPGEIEVAYNGLDDDCDPGTWDDDLDADGAMRAVDCDDMDPTVFQDCVDCDADGDGFEAIACGGDDCYDVAGAGANTYPGAAENNSLVECQKDDDGDGHGDAYPYTLPPGVTPGTDCNDSPGCVVPDCSVLHPDRGDPMLGSDVYYNEDDPEGNHFGGNNIPENCEPNRDNDFDGYCNALDADGIDLDGDGMTDDEAWCFGGLPAGDCENTDPSVSEDDDPTVNPGVAEVTDGIDNDCDGAIDENNVAGCAAGTDTDYVFTWTASEVATSLLPGCERYASAAEGGLRVSSWRNFSSVDAGDLWDVDVSVANQVTWETDDECADVDDVWYCSIQFTDAASNPFRFSAEYWDMDGDGVMEPGECANKGVLVASGHGVAGTVTVVNNGHTPGNPNGIYNGCEYMIEF